MKEFLETLGITLPGYENDDLSYVIDIPDSNEYSRIFTKLDSNDQLHEVPNEDDTFNFNVISYESELYNIDLYSNYDTDEYRLECSKKEDELGL